MQSDSVRFGIAAGVAFLYALACSDDSASPAPNAAGSAGTGGRGSGGSAGTGGSGASAGSSGSAGTGDASSGSGGGGASGSAGAGGSAGSAAGSGGAGDAAGGSAGSAGTGGSAGSAGTPGSNICPAGSDALVLNLMNVRPQRVAGVPPDPPRGQNIEGPVWIEGSLYLSEITFGSGIDPARILKHTPGGATTVFLDNGGTNGLALTNDGKLLAARHLDGSISIIDLTNPSQITPVVSQYMGARFNSPNDIAVHSNGGIYFTDPDYQGPDQPPQAEERAYWVPAGGMPQPIAMPPTKPNGITLSRDEATLFILGQNGLFRYAVAANGSVGARTNMTNQGGDGMGKDCAGNLYITQGNQVRVFDRMLRELTPPIAVPLTGGSVTNVAFGGADRRTLFVTSLNPASLFSVELNVPGYPY